MSEYFIFILELVFEGYFDKMVDQILDVVLDVIIKDDLYVWVVVEIMVKIGMVVIVGEVCINIYVDLEDIVCNVILDIGYNSFDVGFDGVFCVVLNVIGKQFVDIVVGVDEVEDKDLGVGD